jgi:hypothetical protein
MSHGPCLIVSECVARAPIKLPTVKAAMIARTASALVSLNEDSNMVMIYPRLQDFRLSALNPLAQISGSRRCDHSGSDAERHLIVVTRRHGTSPEIPKIVRVASRLFMGWSWACS